MNVENLFAAPRDAGLRAEEVFEELLCGGGFRLERIVSTGQTTPPGEWYDQPQAEWVLLLSGRALLRFEADAEPRELVPGDFVNIPAHCRHRVEFTATDEPTVWLALHYDQQ
jgi:cupin 2 domain-containing protein